MFHSSRLAPVNFPRKGLAVLAALVAALSGFPLACAADVPLSLTETLQLAKTRSRGLAAQQSAISAAEEMSVSARQLPDPVLRLGVENLPVQGADRFSLTQDFMTMRRIGVTQEFTREEKRRLRGERGEREAERERASLHALTANVERDAATAWIDRYYAERLVSVLQKVDQDAQTLIDAAAAAYRGGRGSQADVLAARAALVNLQDRREQLERQARTAGYALARWLGPDADRTLGAAPNISALRLDVERLDQALQHHPQLGVLKQQASIAESEVRLARAGKRPDWSVEVAYQQRGPAFDNMVSVGVSLPLPLFQGNRQDRDIAAKLARADQAQAQYEDALQAHTAEVRAMVAEWQTGLARLKRIEAERIPVAGQRAEAALAAYRGGTGTLSAVLEARLNERETQIQAFQLANEASRAWAQLNFLVPEHAAHGAVSTASEAGK
jgi:outer membrane protein TolC